MNTEEYLNHWYEQKLAYNTRDVLIYAVGIGLGRSTDDLRFVFENHSDFEVFPTFPITLMFKGTAQDVVQFPSDAMIEGPPMPPLEGVKTGLDGERYIEVVEPLDPEGGELTMKSKLIGVHKRGSGASVETEAQISDAKTGKLKYKIISGAFLVGAKNFKDSGVSNSEKIEVPSRAPDQVAEIPTSPAQPAVYRLSGDYNPLHMDPAMAQMSGFEKPIMHGLCTLGMTASAVVRAFCENDASKFKAIKARFASTVLPGQTLQVEMWKESGDKVVLQTKVKETGKVALSNAYVLLRSSAKL